MDRRRLTALEPQLAKYVAEIVGIIKRDDQRKWANAYIRGLLLDGDRKSVAPLAKRVQALDSSTKNYVQGLQQFINQSDWDDAAVRNGVRSWIAERVGRSGALVLSDMCCVKKGTKSVGVGRQRNPQSQRRANCQIVTLLHYAVGDTAFCVDACLRLPAEWTSNHARCERAGIPRDAMSAAGIETGHLLVSRHAGTLSGVVVAPRPYEAETCRTLPEWHNWQYVLGLDPASQILDLRKKGVRTVRDWALTNDRDFKQVHGLSTLGTSYANWRVLPTYQLAFGRPFNPNPNDEESMSNKVLLQLMGELWLVAVRHSDERPMGFFLSNCPATWSSEQFIERLRTLERAPTGQRLDEEVGFGHFEGRSWRGWQHHVTMAIAAHAFLTACNAENAGGCNSTLAPEASEMR